MTAPLTDADLAAMEARAEARVRWCEWAPTRLAPPSEFCGAACVVRCDGCAVTRCAAHAVECDGDCVHAWTTLAEKRPLKAREYADELAWDALDAIAAGCDDPAGLARDLAALRAEVSAAQR